MKKLHWVLIILFFAVLITPLAAINTGANQVSEIDNRKLAEFPALDGSVSIKSGIESYLSDRVGFRTAMINFYTVLHDKLFNIMIHPTYTYGKDGYVFFKIAQEDANEAFTKDFVNFIEKLQAYCEEKGVKFLFWLNPAKTTVYSEYLPDGVRLTNAQIKLLRELLEDKNIHYLESLPALLEAKKTTQVFNVKYDAGHWNDNGAFIGFSLLMDELKKFDSNVLPLSKSDYEITQQEYTTLPVSYFKIHDVADVYTRINSHAEEQTKYNGYLRINKYHPAYGYYINTANPDGPRVMVFRGSYVGSREKFIIDQVSETIFIHNYQNVLDFIYYYNIFKPDIVVFEVAEYAIKDSYFSQEGLQKAVFPPDVSHFASLPEENFASLTINQKKDDVENNESGGMKEKGNSPLVDLSYAVNGGEISYAYLKLGDEWFDFILTEEGEKQTIDITLDKDKLKEFGTMEVVLISKDQTMKNTLTLSNELYKR